jgi:hypothetical protein
MIHQYFGFIITTKISDLLNGIGLQTPSGSEHDYCEFYTHFKYCDPERSETLPPRSGGRGCKPRPAQTLPPRSGGRGCKPRPAQTFIACNTDASQCGNIRLRQKVKLIGKNW